MPLVVVRTESVMVKCAAATAQTLPFDVAAVNAAKIAGSAVGTVSASVATALTPVTGTPAAGDVQFTGTTAAPSDAITLEADPAAGEWLQADVVRPGELPAWQ